MEAQLAPNELAKLQDWVARYEEIARRAPDEIGALGSLPAPEGAALWRRLIVGGLSASNDLRRAANHPAIDLESWRIVRSASKRLSQAANALIALSAERVEERAR